MPKPQGDMEAFRLFSIFHRFFIEFFDFFRFFINLFFDFFDFFSILYFIDFFFDFSSIFFRFFIDFSSIFGGFLGILGGFGEEFSKIFRIFLKNASFVKYSVLPRKNQ